MRIRRPCLSNSSLVEGGQWLQVDALGDFGCMICLGDSAPSLGWCWGLLSTAGLLWSPTSMVCCTWRPLMARSSRCCRSLLPGHARWTSKDLMPDVLSSNSGKQGHRRAHKDSAGSKGPPPSLNVTNLAYGSGSNSSAARTETGTGTGLEEQLHQWRKAPRIHLGYLAWDWWWHRRGWQCVSLRGPSRGSDRCS